MNIFKVKSVEPREIRPYLLKLGNFLLKQVRQRFQTGGKSGGVLWADKRVHEWGYQTGYGPLRGKADSLMKSFQMEIVGGSVEVSSNHPGFEVNQLGTVSKGGRKPDITPKTAKALFIPITERAKSSQTMSGKNAVFFRSAYGYSTTKGNLKVPVSGRQILAPGGIMVHSPLRKGRLVDGQLEVWDEDEQEYVPGIPDFIFLQKVSIPPRPMLPDSRKELDEQKRFVNRMFDD